MSRLSPAFVRQCKRGYQYYLTVVFSLALTLTMVFSVFSILDAAFFKPLPYGDSEQLLLVEGQMDYNGSRFAGTNSQNLLGLTKERDLFAELALYFSWSEYKLFDEPTRPNVPVIMASNNLFEVLKVKPVLGRFFGEEEALGNKQPSAVISFKVWQNNFGGDAQIIGKSLQLNQRRFTIIGVTPDDWVLPYFEQTSQAIWLPLDMDEQLDPKSFGGYSSGIKALGRLQPGITLDEANSRLSEKMAAQASINTPDAAKQYPISGKLTPMVDAIRGDSGRIILMLVAAVLLLTLIALINLGNLQLARAVGRVQSVAISFAFGATRKQLFKEVFQHNLLVTGLAALLAIGLTASGFGVLSSLGSGLLPRLDTLGVSGLMLLFALVVTLLIAVIFSAIELKAIDESRLQHSLQSSGKGTGKQLNKGIGHSLIGLQLLFSVLTLAAASQVLMGSLSEALRPNLINTERLWTVDINYSGINEGSERRNIQRAVADYFRGLPQISSVSRSSEPRVPVMLNTDGIADSQGDSIGNSRVVLIDEQYLGLFGIEVEGRSFSRDDLALEHKGAIINARLAEKFVGNPIGQKFSLSDKSVYEIVGIAGNTDYPGSSYYETGEIYLPSSYLGERSDSLLLAVESGFEGFTHAQLYAALLVIDPRLDLIKVSSVEADFLALNQNLRFAAALAFAISLASLLMVCAGISGMVSYMVRMGRYDMGVKLAMGATEKRLLKSQLLSLAKPIAAAALLGFSLVYFILGYTRVEPDWHFAIHWTPLLLSVLLVLGFSAICCFVPVWRVLKTDPIKALRNE